MPARPSDRRWRAPRSSLVSPFGARGTSSADRALVRVRKLCLSLPETSETDSWGHPNYRAGKRTFVTYEWIRGIPTIAFRLSPAEVRQRHQTRGFLPTPYGRGQWVSMEAHGRLDWRLVGELILKSYRQVAIKRMVRALEERTPKGGAPPSSSRRRRREAR
jgi:predicted DNA-binding protein (MmcQ/YjbR family)